MCLGLLIAAAAGRGAKTVGCRAGGEGVAQAGWQLYTARTPTPRPAAAQQPCAARPGSVGTVELQLGRRRLDPVAGAVAVAPGRARWLHDACVQPSVYEGTTLPLKFVRLAYFYSPNINYCTTDHTPNAQNRKHSVLTKTCPLLVAIIDQFSLLITIRIWSQILQGINISA